MNQEPIARVTGTYGGRFVVEPLNPAMVLPTNMALYAEPQPKVEQEPDDLTIAYMSGFYDGKKKREWVGLTDEEQNFIYQQMKSSVAGEPFWVRFAHAIEQALKEKNNG